MASLRKRGKREVFYVVFRYCGRQYERSLNTSDPERAEHLINAVRARLFRLARREEEIPASVRPDEYVLYGAKARAAKEVGGAPTESVISLEKATDDYLSSRHGKCEESYSSSQRTHLRHLKKWFGDATRCSEITANQIQDFQRVRVGSP